MHQHYSDLLDLAGLEPAWWQAQGVPRFCEFSPEEAPDIYADEVALVEIACQSCDTRFHVCFTSSATSCVKEAMFGAKTKEEILEQVDNFRVSSMIRNGTLRYGDPPNIACCPAGPSMTSEPVAVLEYWSRNEKSYVKDGIITDLAAYRTWKRDPSLEVKLPGL